MMMVMRTNQTARKKADLVGPTTFKRLQVCGEGSSRLFVVTIYGGGLCLAVEFYMLMMMKEIGLVSNYNFSRRRKAAY